MAHPPQPQPQDDFPALLSLTSRKIISPIIADKISAIIIVPMFTSYAVALAGLITSQIAQISIAAAITAPVTPAIVTVPVKILPS